MALFLDSADVADARRAMELGFVAGITTNPTLIARTGRPALEVIAELCAISKGPVFYQLTTGTEGEARRFHALAPSRIVLKIPASLSGLRLVASLSSEIPCAVTAIFSAAQAYLACQAGARYVIPYVNRLTRLGGDGIALVRRIAAILGPDTELLAASLKSPAEVVDALAAGAHHVTVPWKLIEEMAGHRLSALAVEEFARAASS